MFHFTLRHKSGKTFGPDGLSRRDPYPGDPQFTSSEEFEDEPYGPPELEVDEDTKCELLDIEQFKDFIDNRKGYHLGVAKSFKDILIDCDEARKEELALLVKAKKQVVDKARMNGSSRKEAVLLSETILPELPPIHEHEIPAEDDYYEGHRTEAAIRADERLLYVKQWLLDRTVRPIGMDDNEYLSFIRFASHFFVDKDGKLFRRGIGCMNKLVIEKKNRMFILRAVHDKLGHRGFFATKALVEQRFWWPEFEKDISWFIKTCDPCQKRQKLMIKIPPTETYTPSIFQVIHLDTMMMTPKSNKCGMILHARCALTSWPEAKAVPNDKAKTIAKWIFEEIITRWGSVRLFIVDNAPQYKAVMDWLERKYGVKGIKISAYNSQANGKVEKYHWDIRQMLNKATGGDLSKWYWFLPHVLWADRITIRKGLGCSPYFMVTGAHPVIPLDLLEATWLVEPPDGPLSTADLVGLRAKALAKHQTHVLEMRARVSRTKRLRILKYLKKYKNSIRDYKFKPGELVLIRNSAIKDHLDRKMYDRYLGPLIVIKRSAGGSYVLAEMDGSVFDKKVAAFRVIPYYARRKVELPRNIHDLIDLTPSGLERLEDSDEPPEDESEQGDKDFTFDGIKLRQFDDDNLAIEEELDEMGSSDEESNSEIEDNRTKRVTRSSKLKRRKVVKD